MNTQEIANKLVEYCRKGDFTGAQKELYADDAVSIEPEASQGFEKETKGLNAILEKGKQFGSMVETTHGINVSEPVVSGNSFAMALDMDVTMKGQGRSNMKELCVYNVKDGKIVSESFHM